MNTLLTLSTGQFTLILWIWGALGVISALSLWRSGMMPMSGRRDNASLAALGTINKRAGWIIQEIPVLITVLYFYVAAGGGLTVSSVFIAVFVVHYTNRALIFPYRIKVQDKRMPVMIMLFSMIFYAVNGYLIGYYFGALHDYPPEWLWDPRFVLGMALFGIGMLINIGSDNILMRLRKPGETGYKIPQGGLFRWVSCPNYFGEILEWIGFAIMSWSLMGLVYATWVGLPLLAQGFNAHRWYIEKFGDRYPARRKAVVPFLL